MYLTSVALLAGSRSFFYLSVFFVCLTANFLIIRNNRKAKKIRTKSKNNFWGYLGKNFKSIVTPTRITYYDDIHITQTRTKNHFILLFFILLKEKIFFFSRRKSGEVERKKPFCYVSCLRCALFFVFLL